MIFEWIMIGLKVFGVILLVMGIVILMCYLLIKKYWLYFLIGFVLLVFGVEFFLVLGVVLVGVVLVVMYIMNY